MKKIITLAAFLIVISGLSTAYGQTKENEEAKKEQEKEYREFEKQKQVLSEEFREQIRAAARAGDETRAVYGVSSGYAAPSFVTTADGFVFTAPGRGSSSQLSMSKTFNGESKKNEGSFDVDETVQNISLSLNGSVKKGEIKIKVTLSNGDVFKELTIDESADIQFSQNIKIGEDEEKYYGKWKYIVESVGAEGSYRLMINTR